MSSSCETMKVALLNEEERKEEKERLASQIYDLNSTIQDLKSDYQSYQSNGDYDEMENLASELCTLEEEKKQAKDRLEEFKETRFY